MKTALCTVWLGMIGMTATASAATLANCDATSYQVIVNGMGQEREVTLTRTNGVIHDPGPVVSFQIKGSDDPPVISRQWMEEYCIWNGKIRIQRRSRIASHHRS